MSARAVALPALLSALSLMILWFAQAAPWGRMGLVAAAGLMPAAAVISVGPGAGWFCWAGTAALAFLLLPDKACGLLYLIFFGLYPMVKHIAEKLRRRPLEFLVKLAFFNLCFAVMWFGFQALFLWGLPGAGTFGMFLFPAGNIIFLLYDFGFSRLIAFYIARVDGPLRRGQKF